MWSRYSVLGLPQSFDTVPHRRLLLKLKRYGFPEEMVNCLSAFLAGRKMRVGVNGAFSRWPTYLVESPGFSARLRLFILFVNDLPDWMVNSMKMFADDTKI